MQEIKITPGQGIFLIIGMIFPTAMLTVPTAIVKVASTDAWLSLLLGTGVGIITAWICSSLAMKHPGLTFFQIMERHFGLVCSKTVGFLFFLFFLISSTDVIRQFTDFLTDSVLRKTPSIVFGIIIVCIALFALHHGLEVIARVNMLLAVGGFLIFAVSTTFYFHEMKLSNLLPIFDKPIGNILMGCYMSCSWFTEVFAIVLFASFLTNPNKARTVAIAGISLTGLGLIWVVLGCIAIFGVKIIPLFEYPTFSVFRIIEVAGFLERIDAFYIAVWVGLMFMKVAIMMFFGFYCLCHIFAIKEPKPFLLPYGMLALTFSVVSWEGKVEFKKYLSDAAMFYILISLAVPAILYVAMLWNQARKKVTV